MIADALAGVRVARAVDLGCGTGLMGVEIRPLCDRLEGVDLSARMLAEARRKGIYDSLVQAELLEFLAADPGGIGLATAADVLIYCGPLPPVLAAAYAELAPGGLFGFSLELHDRAGTLLQRRQLRYAHNADEALAACRDAGFEIVATERVGIRKRARRAGGRAGGADQKAEYFSLIVQPTPWLRIQESWGVGCVCKVQ